MSSEQRQDSMINGTIKDSFGTYVDKQNIESYGAGSRLDLTMYHFDDLSQRNSKENNGFPMNENALSIIGNDYRKYSNNSSDPQTIVESRMSSQTNKRLVKSRNSSLNKSRTIEVQAKASGFKLKRNSLKEEENLETKSMKKASKFLKDDSNGIRSEKSQISNNDGISVSYSRIHLDHSFLDNSSILNSTKTQINDYILLKTIGSGSFGKVVLAIHIETKKKYAIKVINYKNILTSLSSRNSIEEFNLLGSEIAIMKRLNHPHIIQFYEAIHDRKKETLYLVMEYANSGHLYSKAFWKRNKGDNIQNLQDENKKNHAKNRILTHTKIKKLFKQIVEGIYYLHEKIGIVHRDIKPENLLISTDNEIKLADFGLSFGDDIESQIKDEIDDEEFLINRSENYAKKEIYIKTNIGTKLFMPPEAYTSDKIKGKPQDIWALGCTQYFMNFNILPFNGNTQDQLKENIINSSLEFPCEIDPVCKNQLIRMLEKDPEKRINILQIISNEYMSIYNTKRAFKLDIGQEFNPMCVNQMHAFTVLKREKITGVKPKIRRSSIFKKME